MSSSGENVNTSEKSPTRWGIVGAGYISNDYALALRTFTNAEHEIVAVAARKLEDAQQFAKKYGIAKAYEGYDSISKDSDIDVVYIGTIHISHVELSIAMLNAGKHVVCEKPMALSAADAKRVIDVAHKTKRLFVEGIWSRFFPMYHQLRKELEIGTVGDVRALTVQFGFVAKVDRVTKKELGGGGILDIGCYTTQLACLVFKNEKPEKIFAHGTLRETGVDKTVSTTLVYKNGQIAQFLISTDCVLENKACIFGHNGCIELPQFWCPERLKTPKKEYHVEVPPTSEPTHFSSSAGFVYEIAAVRDAILHGKTEVSEMTHADSLLIAEIQDEILRQMGVTY